MGVNEAILRAVWDPSAAKKGIAETRVDIASLGRAAKGALKEAWDGAGGLKGILGIAAAAEGIILLKRSITDLVKDTAAEERGMQRLGVTLQNIGAGDKLGEVSNLFGKLQQQTTFADDAIAEAFKTLVQGTGDYAVSRKYLNTVLDASIALDRDVASSAQLVAMVIEGNNKAVGMAVPQMRTFAATLDDIADPAERARLMMKRLQEIVGGQAEADTKTLAGATARLKNNWGELMQTMLVNSGVLDATAKGIKGVTDAVIALQNAGKDDDPRNWKSMQFLRLIPFKGPTSPGDKGRPTYDRPIGPMTKEEFERSRRWGTIDEGTMGDNFWLPPDRRQRGARSRPLEMSIEGLDDAKKAYDQFSQDAAAKFTQDQIDAQRALGESLKSSLMGAFEAATQGGKAFIDYLKGYFKKAVMELAAGGLINLAFGAGTVGTGILGKVFGLSSGASASIDRNLSMRRVRLS